MAVTRPIQTPSTSNPIKMVNGTKDNDLKGKKSLQKKFSKEYPKMYHDIMMHFEEVKYIKPTIS